MLSHSQLPTLTRQSFVINNHGRPPHTQSINAGDLCDDEGERYAEEQNVKALLRHQLYLVDERKEAERQMVEARMSEKTNYS